MKIALIGHRGVGKSSLLKRIQHYYHEQNQSVLCIDLDNELETFFRKSIQTLFEEEGEASFRQKEIQRLQHIQQQCLPLQQPVYIALGAGFLLDHLSSEWSTLWVRRATDSDGRIFFDRPRLHPELSALEEFLNRFKARQKQFQRFANRTLILEEGLEEKDVAEQSLFLNSNLDLKASFTLLPEILRTKETFQGWLEQPPQIKYRWFELRDDQLTLEQMKLVLQALPRENILVSFRNPQLKESTQSWVQSEKLSFDWPLEYGDCLWGQPRYLSLHTRSSTESLSQLLQTLPTLSDPTQLKLAIKINDFQELALGDQWFNQNPKKNIFLPCSFEGRWYWYRLLRASDYSLNFIRESEGSSADQPTVLQWIRRKQVLHIKNNPTFAAVLGDPIVHSRTPIEHFHFFKSDGISTYAIHMKLDEGSSSTFSFLARLGLRFAAITAPLKSKVYPLCSEHRGSAKQLGTVNTLFFQESTSSWIGYNTDDLGFQAWIQKLPFEAPNVVWGGGGILPVLKKHLPKALFFSARTGLNRQPNGLLATEIQPKTLLWAAGNQPNNTDLPKNWKPTHILDLSYTESSLGRWVALQFKATYWSGLSFFYLQAQYQREFWQSQLSSEQRPYECS